MAVILAMGICLFAPPFGVGFYNASLRLGRSRAASGRCTREQKAGGSQ